MNNKKIATIAILTTVFFWGGSGSITKIALRSLSPTLLVTLRSLIAGLLLLVASKIRYGKIVLPREEHKKLAVCGFLGYSLYYYLETYSFSMISAANGTLILAVIPLLTVIVEVVWLKESVSFNKGLGIFVSMLGVALVIGKSISVSTDFREILGIAIMLLAAISWTIYSIFTKKLNPKYPSMLMTAYQMFYGVLFLSPFLILEKESIKAIDTLTVLSVIYLALFCSAVACFLYLVAIKVLGASNTNVYINLTPFIGVVVAYFVLGESLDIIQYIGGAIIVLGVLIVNYSGKQKQDYTLSS